MSPKKHKNAIASINTDAMATNVAAETPVVAAGSGSQGDGRGCKQGGGGGGKRVCIVVTELDLDSEYIDTSHVLPMSSDLSHGHILIVLPVIAPMPAIDEDSGNNPFLGAMPDHGSQAPPSPSPPYHQFVLDAPTPRLPVRCNNLVVTPGQAPDDCTNKQIPQAPVLESQFSPVATPRQKKKSSEKERKAKDVWSFFPKVGDEPGRCRSCILYLWTNPIFVPFMAATMHWIQSIEKKTACSIQYELKLCPDLVGFYHVPQHHTGAHLSSVFIHIIKCLGITNIGWITLDNASNNDTLMDSLKQQLHGQGIPFTASKNSYMAVLSKVTDVSHAAVDSDDATA
ncbi:hypothetical protein NP233_g10775 [Leucocoprinus birnbaumii]|uniref:Uncharacterized protein n=1 Tax=Leucocoprinus birnbaumii TaxID=56174 RepID=A0AAD5VHS4_9AGAR|nr:hypothetical protein NP233_g10775 [Leucocoprinus birnbaumii]